jgi:hypothetical protein
MFVVKREQYFKVLFTEEARSVSTVDIRMEKNVIDIE